MTRLVDTNVLIDVLRGHPPALAWMEKTTALPTAVSAATVAELHVGADRREGEKAVHALIKSMEVIALDGPMAERAGQWLRRYGKSHGVDLVDAVIAATAHFSGASLITLNDRHYPMLKRVERPY